MERANGGPSQERSYARTVPLECAVHLAGVVVESWRGGGAGRCSQNHLTFGSMLVNVADWVLYTCPEVFTMTVWNRKQNSDKFHCGSSSFTR